MLKSVEKCHFSENKGKKNKFKLAIPSPLNFDILWQSSNTLEILTRGQCRRRPRRFLFHDVHQTSRVERSPGEPQVTTRFTILTSHFSAPVPSSLQPRSPNSCWWPQPGASVSKTSPLKVKKNKNSGATLCPKFLNPAAVGRQAGGGLYSLGTRVTTCTLGGEAPSRDGWNLLPIATYFTSLPKPEGKFFTLYLPLIEYLTILNHIPVTCWWCGLA